MKIKRARGHRLYTDKGEKILDLSMDFGRAVIGHRPNGVSLTLKNIINRGVYASYDSIYNTRLIKYLNSKFPGFENIYFLNSEDKVLNIFKSQVKDPLFENCNEVVAAYWRPFLDTPNAESLILLYPLPGLNSVTLVVSKKPLSLKSERISPVLLSGILRSFYDYDAELKEFNKDGYRLFAGISGSKLIAPYLVLNRDEEEYKKMCCRAIDEGVLLNSEKQIVVLPRDYSHGEIKKVLNILG